MSPIFTIGQLSAVPVVMTAIHAGHDLRPEIAAEMQLDEAVRLREEDPFTDRMAVAGTSVVVHRSRFEVDMNRPRDDAIYTTPDTSWGLDVWRRPLPSALLEASLAQYDQFYAAMTELLDGLARQGPFLVLDLHSYNHRRGGPDDEVAPSVENPEVNVGTGSLDRGRWGGVVDCFNETLAAQRVAGHVLDVRENVKFEGGQWSRWVNERYGGVGAALAIECKKVFMDEWTGVPDDAHLSGLAVALAAAIPATLDELTVAVP